MAERAGRRKGGARRGVGWSVLTVVVGMICTLGNGARANITNTQATTTTSTTTTVTEPRRPDLIEANHVVFPSGKCDIDTEVEADFRKEHYGVVHLPGAIVNLFFQTRCSEPEEMEVYLMHWDQGRSWHSSYQYYLNNISIEASMHNEFKTASVQVQIPTTLDESSFFYPISLKGKCFNGAVRPEGYDDAIRNAGTNTTLVNSAKIQFPLFGVAVQGYVPLCRFRKDANRQIVCSNANGIFSLVDQFRDQNGISDPVTSRYPFFSTPEFELFSLSFGFDDGAKCTEATYVPEYEGYTVNGSKVADNRTSDSPILGDSRYQDSYAFFPILFPQENETKPSSNRTTFQVIYLNNGNCPCLIARITVRTILSGNFSAVVQLARMGCAFSFNLEKDRVFQSLSALPNSHFITMYSFNFNGLGSSFERTMPEPFPDALPDDYVNPAVIPYSPSPPASRDSLQFAWEFKIDPRRGCSNAYFCEGQDGCSCRGSGKGLPCDDGLTCDNEGYCLSSALFTTTLPATTRAGCNAAGIEKCEAFCPDGFSKCNCIGEEVEYECKVATTTGSAFQKFVEDETFLPITLGSVGGAVLIISAVVIGGLLFRRSQAKKKSPSSRLSNATVPVTPAAGGTIPAVAATSMFGGTVVGVGTDMSGAYNGGGATMNFSGYGGTGYDASGYAGGTMVMDPNAAYMYGGGGTVNGYANAGGYTMNGGGYGY